MAVAMRPELPGGRKARQRTDLQGKALIVNSMPVQRIHFLDLHSIDYAEENSQREKVSGGIHH